MPERNHRMRRRVRQHSGGFTLQPHLVIANRHFQIGLMRQLVPDERLEFVQSVRGGFQ